MSNYGDLLDKLGGGGGAPVGPPPAAAQGVNLGKPPVMPGLPPKPTGVGAMPTGDPSTTKKAAADNAVLSLRELQGYYPSLKQMLDAAIDGIKALAKGAGGAEPPAAAVGEPAPPGAQPPAAPASPLSGSPGPM